MRRIIFYLVVLGALASAAPALAAFPYVGDSTSPGDVTTWHVNPGQDLTAHTGAPNEIGCDTWKMAATPEPDHALVKDCFHDATNNPSKEDPAFAEENAQNAQVRADPHELGGVRGDSTTDIASGVNTAWNVTLGRPDVTIAVLDSGILWNDAGAMHDLRTKVRLNKGELPAPQVDTSLVGAAGHPDCTGAYHAIAGEQDYNHNPADTYDVNNDGVFNVLDYACDPRVSLDSSTGRHGPANVLTPEDLIIAFSKGQYAGDHDHNGFANDIAGWNFVDNNNNPYDDVQYGHGTGEARDSTAEANNGGGVGTCPDCTVLPLRVGESFIADVNRFAQATLYASDNGASIVQEALGTLNNSTIARNAIDYAYNHGVTVVASAADEAAQHHNQPGVLPHTVLVNSVTRYNVPFTPQPRSYLQFNGCTNFMTKVTVSVPSSSCSSEATGRSAGIVGLIYSAALNHLKSDPNAVNNSCHRVAGGTNGANGQPCVVTPNEVRQLLQSQADDVNFSDSELTCPAANCTDPNSNAPPSRADVSPLANTKPYPARKGFDEFYGYGRLNAYRSVLAASQGAALPEASIESPDWWQRIDPGLQHIDIQGQVGARTSDYRCTLYVAPGSEPNNGSDVSNGNYGDESSGGDFHPVPGGFCDGTSTHNGLTPANQVLGSIDTATLKSYFPPQTTGYGFNGNENGGTAQTSNGRPNTEPYGFTVKVVVQTTGGTPLRGEDRRNLYLHRDQDMVPGFPKELRTDGASSPLLVDLDGDNRNELVVATSDGLIHAYRPDGSELPGWPVHTDPLALHTGEPAFASGAISTDHYGAVLGGLAAGDLFHDGRIEILADDNEGKVYAWDASGHQVFKQEANPAYSGNPATSFQRQGSRDRVEHGFFAGPVLANLAGDRNGPLDIIVAGEDRHLYAWHPNGSSVAGFPVLMVDPTKVQSVDPTTHHVTFKSDAGDAQLQGKVIDTPAVAYLDGPNHPPSIVVGTNEEYKANNGSEGPFNASLTNASLQAVGAVNGVLNAFGQGSVLTYGNSRLYVVKHDGNASGNPFVANWPRPVGQVTQELLPDVGEGITGDPVVGAVRCGPNDTNNGGPKIGVISDAGPGYLFNPDGNSCLGKGSNGQDNALQTDVASSPSQHDTPAFPAVGNPAFGNVGPGGQTAFLAPVAGLMRALDAAAPEYQSTSQDFLAAWNPLSGQFQPGFPSPVNDLQFLTGPAVGDVTGLPAPQEAAVEGTASLDLTALNSAGAPASPNWPKLTGDWIVANPLLGSFGTLDTDPAAKKDVVSITRSGTLSVYSTPAAACAPSSWPRFHHDLANSGDFNRDAIPPGRIDQITLGNGTITFAAPGDDGLCGTVTSYEVRGGRGQGIAGPSPPLAAAGALQTISLPSDVGDTVTIWAVDDQGNRGRSVTVNLRTNVVTVDGPGTATAAKAGGTFVNAPSSRPAPKSCLNGPFRFRFGARSLGPVHVGASTRTLNALLLRRHGRGILTACVRRTPRNLVIAVTRGRVVSVGTRAGVVGTLHPGAPGRRIRGLRRVRGVVPGLYRRGRVYAVVGRRGRVAYVFITSIRDRRALRATLRRSQL